MLFHYHLISPAILVEISLKNVPVEKRLRVAIKNLAPRLYNFNSKALVLNIINSKNNHLPSEDQNQKSLVFEGLCSLSE